MSNNVKELFPVIKKSSLAVFWEREGMPTTIYNPDFGASDDIMEHLGLDHPGTVEINKEIQRLEANWGILKQYEKFAMIPSNNKNIVDQFIMPDGSLRYLESSEWDTFVNTIKCDLRVESAESHEPGITQWLKSLTSLGERCLDLDKPQWTIKLADLSAKEKVILSLFGTIFKLVPHFEAFPDMEFFFVGPDSIISFRLDVDSEIISLL